MRTLTATKNHGKCALCPKQIKKGERYVRGIRHATEAEKEDPNVKTFSLVGKGPHVEYKVHEACTEEKRDG